MTKQEKLTKLIEIAVENGWKKEQVEATADYLEEKKYIHDFITRKRIAVINSREKAIKMARDVHKKEFRMESQIIFSHSFAKAIWGEDLVDASTGYEEYFIPSWKYNLKEAVISKDPLEYYWENK